MTNPIQKYLLSEYRKRVSSAQIRRVLARRAPSMRGVENSYNADVQRLQRRLNKEIKEAVKPLVEPAVRMDGIGDVDGIFAELSRVLGRYLTGFLSAAKTTSTRVQVANNRRYEGNEVYRTIGLHAISDSVVSPVLGNWVDRNVELITQMNEAQLGQLKGLFRDSAFTGTRHKSLVEQIQKITKHSRKRAELIARDQVQKLGGQLDELKQRNAGVSGYYWRSSRDERVRSSHAEREGKFFKWDTPPEGGHPGQDIGCRCDAEPAIDRMLLSGKELRESLAESEAENARLRAEAVAKSKAGPIKFVKKSRSISDRVPKPVPLRPEISMPRTGRRVELSTPQQKFDQAARTIKSNPDKFVQATIEEQQQALHWNWIHGSRRKMSIQMIEAAKKEFNLRGVVWNKRGFAVDARAVKASQKALRKTYENTQRELRKLGLEKVRVYRGVRGEGPFTQGAVESWTSDLAVAKKFGNNIMAKEVPIEKVLNFQQSRKWVDGAWGNQAEWIIME